MLDAKNALLHSSKGDLTFFFNGERGIHLLSQSIFLIWIISLGLRPLVKSVDPFDFDERKWLLTPVVIV